jgi:hypothetical protein
MSPDLVMLHSEDITDRSKRTTSRNDRKGSWPEPRYGGLQHTTSSLVVLILDLLATSTMQHDSVMHLSISQFLDCLIDIAKT